MIKMLKLLICEDEALERKAIRFLVNKFYRRNVEVVGESTNGQDAVDRAMQFKPDIILMDIQMPVLDGLEAGAAIRNVCKETEIVILSAFNYFDYAQKSISLGVSDYLLKPYSNEEFCAAMDKVIGRIRVKTSKKNETAEMHRKFEEMIPFVGKEMVTNIVYGVVLTEEKFALYKKLLDITGGKFCCMIFRDEKTTMSLGSLPQIKERLKLLFSDVVGCVCLNDFVVFLFDDALEEKMLSGRFEKIVKSVQTAYMEKMGTALQFGMGCCNDKVGELFLSYNQAKLALEKAEKGADAAQNPAAFMFEPGLKEIIMGLSGRIINEDLDGALYEADHLLSFLSDGSPSTVGKTAKKSFKAVLNNVMEFLGEDCKGFDEGILTDMSKWNSVIDIRCSGHMIVKNLIRFVSNYKKNRNIDTVEKVKKYLASNYMRDISLDDMAEYVSISSYYLSRIFKKVEGINFKDYLIKIRMEKAKNMLRTGDKSVKQVGISVGYSDQDYFSKAFKKYTSFSPREYISS
jgi:YesN/AraC family two-component response regulator